MKINKLMLALLAGAMFASCSDDRSNEPVNPGSEAVGSEGYISIAIGMPSSVSSRATLSDDDLNGSNNDQFDDGTPNEYAVENAAIIFFKGDNEVGSTFYKAYVVSREFKEDAHDQITTSSSAATFPVNFAKDADSKLWALAVLNYNGIFTFSDNKEENGQEIGATVSVGGNQFTTETTIEDVMKLVTGAQMYALENGQAKNFFMTNTPYSRVQGGTTTPNFAGGTNYFRVLPNVDRAKIFATKEEARLNPAAEIFVERAVAKVEVKANELSTNLTGDVSVKKVEWLIDNTEPASYIVRNLEAVEDGYGITSIPSWASYISAEVNNYRFIGQAPLKDLDKYRTYFCADPNGAGLALDAAKGLNQIPAGATYRSTEAPQYCKENTFSVENMNYFNTTRAVIRVTFQDANGDVPTFYTIGLDNKHQYTFDNAASHLTAEALNREELRAAWVKYYEKLETAYENNASTVDMKYYNGTTLYAENNWMKVTFKQENGRLTVSDIEIFDGAIEGDKKNPVELGADAKTAAIAGMNAAMTIKAYTNGFSYYAVRIKHFGDELTPWTVEGDVTTNTTEQSYGWETDLAAANNNYLGRYGVVRNNWYVLNLNTINNFGEPTYNDLPLDGTPDDKVTKEESISCKINILSWAKRSQDVEL